jgi:hypothetical protein
VWWSFVSEHLSAPTPQGTAQRALLNFATLQNNSYGNANSPEPANGEGQIGPGPPVFYHNQPLGHAVDTAGKPDCSNGQTGFTQRMFKYGSPRFQIGVDAFGPDQLGYPLGSYYNTYGPYGAGQGTFPGKIAAGQTFTATPGGTAAQLPSQPASQLP